MSATVTTGFDRAVAEALAWRLVECEQRIALARVDLGRPRLEAWQRAVMRGYLWSCLDERRGLKRRLAKEMER